MNIFPEHLSYYQLFVILFILFLIYAYIRRNTTKQIMTGILGFILLIVIIAIIELIRRAGNIY